MVRVLGVLFALLKVSRLWGGPLSYLFIIQPLYGMCCVRHMSAIQSNQSCVFLESSYSYWESLNLRVYCAICLIFRVNWLACSLRHLSVFSHRANSEAAGCACFLRQLSAIQSHRFCVFLVPPVCCSESSGLWFLWPMCLLYRVIRVAVYLCHGPSIHSHQACVFFALCRTSESLSLHFVSSIQSR